MSKSIVDDYLDRRISNIKSYTNVLFKKTYNKTNNDLKLIEACIYRYINDFEFLKKQSDEIEKDNYQFFKRYNIREKIHKRMLSILLDIITERDKPHEDEKLMDNLFMISRIIAIAYEIEYHTAISVDHDVGLKELIKSIRERYGPYEKEELDNNFKLTNEKLKKLILENIRNDTKYKELINNDHFFMECFHLSDDEGPPGLIYETKVINAYSELEKFNDKKIKELSSEKNILYEYVYINLELAVLKIIEILLNGKNIKMFIIRLPSDFVSKKSNVIKLMDLTKNKLVREKICFRIDRDDLENHYETILKIKNSDFRITIANIDEGGVLTEKLKAIADYIIVDETTKDNDELKQFCKTSNIRLLEQDVGLEDVILEL